MIYGFPVTEQFRLFCLSFGLGVIIGLIYCVIEFFAELIMTGSKRTVFTDVLFSFVLFFVLFCFFLTYSSGKIRLFSLVGTALGTVVYFSSLYNVIYGIFDFISKCIRKVFSLVVMPVKLIVKTVRKISASVHRIFSEKIHKPIAKEKEVVV